MHFAVAAADCALRCGLTRRQPGKRKPGDRLKDLPLPDAPTLRDALTALFQQLPAVMADLGPPPPPAAVSP